MTVEQNRALPVAVACTPFPEWEIDLYCVKLLSLGVCLLQQRGELILANTPPVIETPGGTRSDPFSAFSICLVATLRRNRLGVCPEEEGGGCFQALVPQTHPLPGRSE